MASLAELYGTAKTKARQIPANLRESGKGLASWAVDPYGEAQRVMGEYRNMTPEQRQGLVNATVDLFGGIDVGPVGAIKASHGSPHAFTAFDFSKMGTGEGSQQFGHGGYFAEGFDSPIARPYAYLANNPTSRRAGYVSSGRVSQDTLDAIIKMSAKNLANNNILELLDVIKKRPTAWQYPEEMIQRISEYVDNKPPAFMYNVELKWPNAARESSDPLGEHHLLNWSAPLSKHSEHIQKALADYSINAKPFDIPISHNPTGAELYGMIAAPKSIQPSGASEILKSLGIPGMSHSAYPSMQEGPRNYVMFDDKFPNIVTRNGVSITDLLKNR